MKIRVKRCDHCGRFNPPIFDNNPRLCASCAEPGGCYRKSGSGKISEPLAMGANGKINYWQLQWPFSWRGLWRLSWKPNLPLNLD
jgi:hypothetical protein